MQNIKEFKRGDIIFKENDVIENVLFIQSGRVHLYLERNGKKIEVDQLKNSQVLGELAVFGTVKQPFAAVADSPVKVLEVPAKVLQTLHEGSQPGLKLLTKSAIDLLKEKRNTLKSIKMEQDNSPCPQMAIPRVFSLYVLLGNHTGKKNEEGEIVLSWQALKLYSTRVFQESPQRLEQGLQLLKKLGYVELTTRINEDEEEELADIIFKDIQTIEDFSEFYQYHLYKPGRSEVMYVDEIAFRIVKVLVAMSIGKELNHKGAVCLDYEEVLKELKAKAKVDLKNTHLDLLEKKGLLVERKSTDEGMTLLFDREEYIKTAIFWAFIHEIDQWNEKGFIDFTEEKIESSDEDGESCTDCGGAIKEDQKFCHHCGAKLVEEAS